MKSSKGLALVKRRSSGALVSYLVRDDMSTALRLVCYFCRCNYLVTCFSISDTSIFPPSDSSASLFWLRGSLSPLRSNSHWQMGVQHQCSTGLFWLAWDAVRSAFRWLNWLRCKARGARRACWEAGMASDLSQRSDSRCTVPLVSEPCTIC